MKAKITRALTVCAISCFIAWMGGYDFDTRNGVVGYWALVTIVFAALAAFLPWDDLQ